MKIITLVASLLALSATTVLAGDREERIFRECAKGTGGNPKLTAICASGGLAKQEIDNFFNGEAFGPNNEFVKLWKSLFPEKKFVNDLITTMPFKGGMIYGYRSGVYWSPDGNNPRGGGKTARIYPPTTNTQTAAVIAMVPYENGVTTAFQNSGVYHSPDGQNIGGGGNTYKVYTGSAEVRAMTLYSHASGTGIRTQFSNGVWYCSPDGRNVGGGGNTSRC